MARALKPGLTYFPLDVNFLNDRKIRRLMRKYGASASSVMIALFSYIYGDQGYYVKWDEDICFDLSELTLMKTIELEAIIQDAVESGIFDKKMYDEYKILTSEAIQNQYKMCTNRRKPLIADERYWLIQEDNGTVEGELVQQECTLNGDSADNLSLFDAEMQQTKQKKTKPKQKKEKQTPPNLPCKKKGEDEEERKNEEERKGEEEREDEQESAKTEEIPQKGAGAESSVPAYCLNKTTHNYTGLLDRLAALGVKNEKEVQAILKMSDYGRIGEKVWKIIAYGKWPKGNVIKMPGRYIIALLSRAD